MRPAAPVAFLAFLGASTLATGCHNACQALCREMYDYAAECGYTVTKEELKACYKDQASANTPRSERQLCRQNFDALREEWTCDDLAAYWDDEGGQPEDTGAGDSVPAE